MDFPPFVSSHEGETVTTPFPADADSVHQGLISFGEQSHNPRTTVGPGAHQGARPEEDGDGVRVSVRVLVPPGQALAGVVVWRWVRPGGDDFRSSDGEVSVEGDLRHSFLVAAQDN